MRSKQKKVDFSSHLYTSAMTFKESLKVIVNLLIENIWKERLEPPMFQETLTKIKAEIWRGPFDQITEVEEELRSSRFYSNRVGDSQLVRPSLVAIPEADVQVEEGNGATQLSSIKNALMANSQIIETEQQQNRDGRMTPGSEEFVVANPSAFCKAHQKTETDEAESEPLNPLNTFKKTIPLEPEQMQPDTLPKKPQVRSSSQPLESRAHVPLNEERPTKVVQPQKQADMNCVKSEYFGSFKGPDDTDRPGQPYPPVSSQSRLGSTDDGKWFSAHLAPADSSSAHFHVSKGFPMDRRQLNNARMFGVNSQTARKEPVYKSIFRNNPVPPSQKKALDRSANGPGLNLGQPTLRAQKKSLI